MKSTGFQCYIYESGLRNYKFCHHAAANWALVRDKCVINNAMKYFLYFFFTGNNPKYVFLNKRNLIVSIFT